MRKFLLSLLFGVFAVATLTATPVPTQDREAPDIVLMQSMDAPQAILSVEAPAHPEIFIPAVDDVGWQATTYITYKIASHQNTNSEWAYSLYRSKAPCIPINNIIQGRVSVLPPDLNGLLT